jgi:competence ComEA-like helix-hairpin-helix protein
MAARDHRPPARGRSAGAEVVETLVSATRAATDEGARRQRALGPQERIDPNRADEVSLDRLPGVGPSTASAIVQARDSGVVFRRADDLRVVKGLGPVLLSRIGPHLDFGAPPDANRARASAGDVTRRGDPVDLNTGTRADLEGLPGIGPALATRIAAARAERPFSSLEDLTRVPGIGPATVERLRGRAFAGRMR